MNTPCFNGGRFFELNIILWKYAVLRFLLCLEATIPVGMFFNYHHCVTNTEWKAMRLDQSLAKVGNDWGWQNLISIDVDIDSMTR